MYDVTATLKSPNSPAVAVRWATNVDGLNAVQAVTQLLAQQVTDTDMPEAIRTTLTGVQVTPHRPGPARRRTPEQVAAQVAVEAVANCPEAYDAETVADVRAAGEAAGVDAFYLDMLSRAACECAAQYLDSAIHETGCPAGQES